MPFPANRIFPGKNLGNFSSWAFRNILFLHSTISVSPFGTCIVPSQSRKWNRNSQIWNFVFQFPKFSKFSTAWEFSIWVLKIVIQNKTKQDQEKKFLHSIVLFEKYNTEQEHFFAKKKERWLYANPYNNNLNEASYFDRITMTKNWLEYDRKIITPIG